MQRKIFFWCLLFSLVFLGEAFARPKIAVLPFHTPSGFESKCPIGKNLSSLVQEQLMSSGKVIIVERRDLERLKSELNLANDSFFDPRTFPKKGGFSGTDYVVSGKVLDYGNHSKDTGLGTLGKLAGGLQQKQTSAYVRIVVEVVDLKQGKVIFAEQFEGQDKEKGTTLLGGDLKSKLGAGLVLGDLKPSQSRMLGTATKRAIAKIIPRLISLFALEGKVIGVSPDGVVLDLGNSSGIAIGSSGTLFRVKEVKNSNGDIVWSSKKPIGRVKITELQPQSSFATFDGQVSAEEGDAVVFGDR